MIIGLMAAMIASYWLHGLAPRSKRLFVEQDRTLRNAFLGGIAVLHVLWAGMFALAFPAVREHVASHAPPLVIAAIAMAFAGLGLALIRPETARSPTSWTAAVLLPRAAGERLWHVPLSLVAGFCEELVLRLALIPALMASGVPAWAAAVGASFSFVLIHGRAALGKFGLYLLAKGLIYSSIFLLTRSLLWPFVIHALSDLAILLRPVPKALHSRSDGLGPSTFSAP